MGPPVGWADGGMVGNVDGLLVGLGDGPPDGYGDGAGVGHTHSQQPLEPASPVAATARTRSSSMSESESALSFSEICALSAAICDAVPAFIFSSALSAAGARAESDESADGRSNATSTMAAVAQPSAKHRASRRYVGRAFGAGPSGSSARVSSISHSDLSELLG